MYYLEEGGHPAVKEKVFVMFLNCHHKSYRNGTLPKLFPSKISSLYRYLSIVIVYVHIENRFPRKTINIHPPLSFNAFIQSFFNRVSLIYDKRGYIEKPNVKEEKLKVFLDTVSVK